MKKALIISLLSFFCSPGFSAVKSSKYQYSYSKGVSKLHRVAVLYRSTDIKFSNSSKQSVSSTGLSYAYTINQKFDAGVEYYSSNNNQGTGMVSMRTNIAEIVPQVLFSAFDGDPSFKLVLGLGVLSETITNSIASSSATASELNPIYVLGVDYRIGMDSFEFAQAKFWKNVELEFGIRYRSEFEDTNRRYLDLKALGLGYRF